MCQGTMHSNCISLIKYVYLTTISYNLNIDFHISHLTTKGHQGCRKGTQRFKNKFLCATLYVPLWLQNPTSFTNLK